MISQQSTSNFQLPKHFHFDRLVNQKKLAHDSTLIPSVQQQPFSFNFDKEDVSKTSKSSESSKTSKTSKSSKTSESSKTKKFETSRSSSRSSRSSTTTKTSSTASSTASSSTSSSTRSRSSSSSSSDDDDNGSYKKSKSKKNKSKRSKRRSSSSSKDSHSLVSKEFKDEFDIQMNDLHEKPLTEEEYRAKQIDLIITLQHLKESGAPVDPRVKLSVDTPLRELQIAHDFAIAHVIRRAKFEQFQQSLTFGTTLLEQGNKLLKGKTGYGAELDGFASHIMMNMPKFNRPLYRLACKYSKITDEASPEMELGRSLLYTACMFHLAKKTSMDPQMMMDFLDFTPSANPNGENDGVENQTASSSLHTQPPTQFPFMTSSPMGLRPNLPLNTRVPMKHDHDSDDSSVESDSSTTESVEV